MSFVVIEGLDGSGKSTQINLLLELLEQMDLPHQYLHFPRTGAPVYGDLIARFLRGEFGDLKTVNPYLVALLYAGDRMDAAGTIRRWMDEGCLVLADRYVYSNIAFQCAKIDKKEEKNRLAEWILHLEYEYYRIPRPRLSLFLDVPFEFTRSQLRKGRSGKDRSYLNGQHDIHEASLEFQKDVREEYLTGLAKDHCFVRIDCSGKMGAIITPEQVFRKILDQLIEKEIIPGDARRLLT